MSASLRASGCPCQGRNRVVESISPDTLLAKVRQLRSQVVRLERILKLKKKWNDPLEERCRSEAAKFHVLDEFLSTGHYISTEPGGYQNLEVVVDQNLAKWSSLCDRAEAGEEIQPGEIQP